MSKLNDLIKELCPRGVNFKKVKEIANVTIGEFVHKDKQSETATYPVYNGGISNTGFYDEYNNEGHKVIISARGANAGYVNRVEGKYWAGNSCYTLNINNENEINWNFLYHFFKSNQIILLGVQQTGSIPAISKKQVEEFKVAIPPLEVQKEIVKILDKFGELEAELEAELEVRKSQYEFWCRKVINESQGKNGKLIDLLSGPITDGPHVTPQFVSEGIPFISVSAIHAGKIYLKDAQGFITEKFDAECSKKYKPKKWDVYMVKSGSTTGKVAIVDIDDNFNIWSPLAAMRTKNEITSKYLYHLLQTKDVQKQVHSRTSHGSQPNLSMRELEKINVKIPTLEEQKHIVDILDKFDKLINDVTEGIPAEIELRRKQYEYYRNKLLSFEELSCE